MSRPNRIPTWWVVAVRMGLATMSFVAVAIPTTSTQAAVVDAAVVEAAVVEAAIARSSAGSVEGTSATSGSAVAAAATTTSVGATSRFVAVAPSRILDTRRNPQKLAAGSTISVAVAGSAGVPSTATAVVLNVTSTDAVDGGYVTVYPAGSPRPNTSNINVPGLYTTVPNLVTVRLSGGAVSIYSSMAGNILVDVFGYYETSASSREGRFVPLSPRRLADTRQSGILSADDELTVALPSGVASDASALVLNVTSVGASGRGYIAAHAAGEVDPDTSNLNVSWAGQTIANQVIVQPSTRGVEIHTTVRGHVIVDLLGWYTGPSSSASSDGLFVALEPSRLLDTRSSPNPLGDEVALHRDWSVEVGLVGRGGVPTTGVGAVALNVTAAATQEDGWLAAYPAGQTRPVVSNLNFDGPGLVIPNHVQVAAGSRGVALYSSGTTDVVVDVFGWFTGVALAGSQAPAANVLPTGSSFPGELSIPQIKLRTKVRENTWWVDKDPSHLPESRSPNQPGNVAIFGHRTSHGREFRNLDRLAPLSLVHLTSDGKRYTYVVTSVDIRLPTDPLLYASETNDQTISLVACHPPGSVKYRIVVHGSLVEVGSV